mgnify:CR=1 FL=1
MTSATAAKRIGAVKNALKTIRIEAPASSNLAGKARILPYPEMNCRVRDSSLLGCFRCGQICHPGFSSMRKAIE